MVSPALMTEYEANLLTLLGDPFTYPFLASACFTAELNNTSKKSQPPKRFIPHEKEVIGSF